MAMNPMVRKLRKKSLTQGNGSHKSDVNAIEITDCFRDAIIFMAYEIISLHNIT